MGSLTSAPQSSGGMMFNVKNAHYQSKPSVPVLSGKYVLWIVAKFLVFHKLFKNTCLIGMYECTQRETLIYHSDGYICWPLWINPINVILK